MTRLSSTTAARDRANAAPVGAHARPTLVDIFKALADWDRLRLFRLFAVTKAEICVCELVDALEIPQYQVSRHLKVLKDAALLSVRRKGTWAYYSALRSTETTSALSALISGSADDEIFRTDEMRLSRRFELRAGDRCVVGLAETQDAADQESCNGCD